MKPRFRILAETTGKDARIVSTLFETSKRHKFEAVKYKIEILAGQAVQRRKCRRVYVSEMDSERLCKFVPSADAAGQMLGLYTSVRAFATRIKANPATVRVALSKAKRKPGNDPHKYATLRGVTFRYEDQT